MYTAQYKQKGGGVGMGKVRLFVVLTFHRSIIKPDGIEIIGSLNYRLYLSNGKKNILT